MYRALTAEQSRAVESRAVDSLGVCLRDLMDRAGEALAAEIEARIEPGRAIVLCGTGNNGGDGWVAARLLGTRGWDVEVLSVRAPEGLHGEAAEAARSAIDAGVSWRVPSAPPSAADLEAADVVVDALLGVGASLPLREPLPAWCEAVNRCGSYVVSADIPTGVDSDSGRLDPGAIEADCTVTFVAPKRGVVVYPGAANAGELAVADLGVPHEYTDLPGTPEIWTDGEYARLLVVPRLDAHKNMRGRVLVVAGSGRFPGAAILAARGAMRAGAGYVTLAVPEPVVPLAQSHLVAAPVIGLPASRNRSFSSSAGQAALTLAADFDAVVLGPGLTLSDGAVAMSRFLVSRLAKPLVVDADALNALVDAADLIETRSAATVLTPHPGELARLLGVGASDVQEDRVSSSAAIAGTNRSVVLKGAGTIVSDYERQVIVTAGSPALATAGTGDVLAGVIGTLLAQGLLPIEAGALGAYLHARAGEEAAADLTPICVTAEDIPDYLPSAVAGLLGSW